MITIIPIADDDDDIDIDVIEIAPNVVKLFQNAEALSAAEAARISVCGQRRQERDS